MFIVSANYRDRKSPYRWLVRRKGHPAESAKAFKHVKASGVTFLNSPSEYELGFGCRVVAHCQSVHCSEPEVKTVNLVFDRDMFWTESGDKVLEAKSLELHPDGRMEAIVS
jgi:hypothetical protein